MSYAKAVSAAIWSGQWDDGLTNLYSVDLGSSPNHVQHTGGIGRTAVKVESGSAGIGQKIQSVTVRFRLFGTVAAGAMATVNIRKIADDSAVTIGQIPISALGPSGQEFEYTVRNRFNQSYQMLSGDSLSIEYPSGVSGFEISTNSSASDPSGYTSRSHNGSTWSSALSDPISCVIKSV